MPIIIIIVCRCCRSLLLLRLTIKYVSRYKRPGCTHQRRRRRWPRDVCHIIWPGERPYPWMCIHVFNNAYACVCVYVCEWNSFPGGKVRWPNGPPEPLASAQRWRPRLYYYYHYNILLYSSEVHILTQNYWTFLRTIFFNNSTKKFSYFYIIPTRFPSPVV